MTTIWADTVGLHDDLGDPRDVDAWLEAVGIDVAGARASAAEHAETVRLRDAVRRLAAYTTGDGRGPAASSMIDLDEAINTLNGFVRHVPTPRLTSHAGRLCIASAGSQASVRAGLATVAEESMELLGGDEAVKLRACYAPGCVLYFVKAHPRREWCSVTCGNRARAARHYSKIRNNK